MYRVRCDPTIVRNTLYNEMFHRPKPVHKKDNIARDICAVRLGGVHSPLDDSGFLGRRAREGMMLKKEKRVEENVIRDTR